MITITLVIRNRALSLILFLLGAAIAQGAQPAIAVRPNTPLAKLEAESRQNPTFLSAAPSGTETKVEIPQWLKAHFRRNHSEFLRVAAPTDPTGGYPLALESLYAWMLRHQDLQPSQPTDAVAATAQP